MGLPQVLVGENKTSRTSIVKAYDAPYSTSTSVYSHIKDNPSSWIEEAVTIRGMY